jgi:uncharacterized protein YwqG
MSQPQHQAKLDRLLKTLVKPAIQFEPQADTAAIAASCESKYGGLPYTEAGDTWPSCPTCDTDLTFVTQIRDERENVLFVFYYCFECFPWGLESEAKGQWVIKLYPDPSMEKLVPIEGELDDEFALTPCTLISSPVEVLPDWQDLDSISPEVGHLCEMLNAYSPWEAYEEAVDRTHYLNDYATLLGGYPRFIQGSIEATCPTCNAPMQFYAQIDSEDEANLMWGDVGLVYFFRCPQHPHQFYFELQCH